MKTLEFISNKLFSVYQGNIIDFLCVLLRVKWMESYDKEPFVGFERLLKKPPSLPELKSILEHRDFIQFLSNIALIANWQRIQLFFFRKFFNEDDLFLKESFLTFLLDSKFPNSSKKQFKALYSEDFSGLGKRGAKSFLVNFFSLINDVRRQAVIGELIYRLPQFETLELLKDSRNRLDWFKVHFSNGNFAQYKRGGRFAECLNVSLQEESIDFFVGDLGGLQRNWKYEGDYLFKKWVKRRYNNFWDWKPLQTLGSELDFDSLASAVSLFEDVRDVARYAMFTSCYSIEFFFLTKIKIEEKDVAFWEITLHRCDAVASDNEYIYDGNILFNALTEEEILKKLQIIEDTKLKLEFIYGDDVKWRLKYTQASHQSGSTLFDLKSFRKFYKTTGNVLSNRFVEWSIDWYLKWSGSENKFNAYLCHAISIERLAIQLYDDDALRSEARISMSTETDEERLNRIRAVLGSCFQDQNKLESDIERLYGEKKSLAFKLKQIFASVFGVDSKEYKRMFEWPNALYKLRHKLAHGEYIERDRTTYSLVKNWLYAINTINRRFILKIIQWLSGKVIPGVKHMKSLHMNMRWPQNMGCVSDINHPSFRRPQGWKIEKEWILEAFDS